MNKINIFGAGYYGRRIVSFLLYLGQTIEYVIDNDTTKYGSMVEGIRIVSPQKLIESDGNIIISVIPHEKAIRKQLESFGVADRIIGLDDCIHSLLKEKAKKETIDAIDTIKTIRLFDVVGSTGWGGIENWNFDVASVIAKRNKTVNIVADDFLIIPDNLKEIADLEIKVFQNAGLSEKFFECIKNKKIIYVNNCFDKAFIAAVVKKIVSPDSIRLISIVHNDYEGLFYFCKIFEQYIDRYICVSSRISNSLNTKWGIRQDKLFFISQPVRMKRINKEKAWMKDTIRIGIASRLTREQKRSDLINLIIDYLEEKKINYTLDIAGTGDLFDCINDHVVSLDLIDKIHLLGRIPYQKMNEFWENHDIYLNCSEYEGASLAMLEAMYHGCVPVVTDVSGVDDFVEHKKNGIICQVDDIESMVNEVEILAKDMEILKSYSERAHEVVCNKCDINKYVDNLLYLIDM